MTEPMKVLSSEQVKNAIWKAIKSKTNKSNLNPQQTGGPWIEDILLQKNLVHQSGENYSQEAIQQLNTDKNALGEFIYEHDTPPEPTTSTIQVPHYIKENNDSTGNYETTINVAVTDRTLVDLNSMMDFYRMFMKGMDREQAALLDGYDIIFDSNYVIGSDEYLKSKYYPGVAFKFIDGHPHPYWNENETYKTLFTFAPDSINYNTRTEEVTSIELVKPFILFKLYFNNQFYEIYDLSNNPMKYPLI
jgi:hypothetical protein